MLSIWVNIGLLSLKFTNIQDEIPPPRSLSYCDRIYNLKYRFSLLVVVDYVNYYIIYIYVVYFYVFFMNIIKIAKSAGYYHEHFFAKIIEFFVF